MSDLQLLAGVGVVNLHKSVIIRVIDKLGVSWVYTFAYACCYEVKTAQHSSKEV